MLSERFKNDGGITLTLNETQLKTRDIVLKKLDSKQYQTESVPCLCGENQFEVLAHKDRYGLPVTTVLCKACGQAMTNPRMKREAYDSFYQNEYRALYVGQEKATDRFFATQYAHGQKILKYLNQKGVKFNNVLEIGCGAGGILKAFQDMGIDTLGIDIGGEYLEFGRTQGVELYHMSSSNLAEQSNRKFDVVILSHVFEHFLDIQSELSVIERLLSDKGALYIEVPGIKNLQHSYECDFLRYLQNAHTYHFSLKTLTTVLNRNNFTLVSGNESIIALFKKADNQIDCSCGDEYDATKSFLCDLELNRELYKQKWRDLKSNKKEEALLLVNNKLSSFSEKSVCIFGTGQHTNKLLSKLNSKEKILGLLDGDQSKIGQEFFAFKVLDLNKIREELKAIVISSDTFQDEIYYRLRELESEGVALIRIYG